MHLLGSVPAIAVERDLEHWRPRFISYDDCIGWCHLTPATRCFRCRFLNIGEINSIVIEHGCSTTPDVEVVARHFGHLIQATHSARN